MPELIRPLAEVEREAILAALKHYDPQTAAGLLGIGKTTIYLRMRKYKFTQPLVCVPRDLAEQIATVLSGSPGQIAPKLGAKLKRVLEGGAA